MLCWCPLNWEDEHGQSWVPVFLEQWWAAVYIQAALYISFQDLPDSWCPICPTVQVLVFGALKGTCFRKDLPTVVNLAGRVLLSSAALRHGRLMWLMSCWLLWTVHRWWALQRATMVLNSSGFSNSAYCIPWVLRVVSVRVDSVWVL